MHVLRPALVTLCLTLPPLAGPAALQARTDPMPLFATCTGRLSALMEFQWLLQDGGADLTRQRRDDMAALLEAVLTPGQDVRAMDLRLQAKVALRDLLAKAAFRRDDPQSEWAARRAQDLLAPCTAMLSS